MELTPRKCLKCGKEIIHIDGELKANWRQHYLELENGNRFVIALCKKCEVLESDFDEITNACKLKSKVVDHLKTLTYRQLALDKQNSKCFLCGLPIEETHNMEVMIGGYARHISCPNQAPEVIEENTKVGLLAKEYQQRNKRTKEY